jgi:GNAT superfamily N-acetyltransferase
MTTPEAGLHVRPATPEDAAALSRILNEIIAIGGTTALETTLSEAAFREAFLDGPDVLSSLIAETAGGEAAGFQVLQRNQSLPEGWGDIATFTRRDPRTPGVGTVLFEHTKAAGRTLGLVAINATIRADNQSGLPFYETLGFRTYDVAKAVPLKDGTRVDRVRKRYSLR